MTATQVKGLAGTPPSRSSPEYNPDTPGSGQEVWTFSTLIVIVQGRFGIGDPALVDPKVVGLRTQSKTFRTAPHHGKRIGVGSKFADIKAAYPTATCGLSRSVHNGPSTAAGSKPISSILSIARNGQVVLKHGNRGVQSIAACQVKKGSTVTVTLGFAVGPADRSKLDQVLIGEH